jgi:hypothetical protein
VRRNISRDIINKKGGERDERRKKNQEEKNKEINTKQ